jgi:hypothetical protein
MTKAEGKIAELAKAKRGKGVLIPELQAAALKTSGADPDRRIDVLHPSEMAKDDWCHRSSYYRIKYLRLPEDEPFSFQMESIFDAGNEAHTKWQNRMRQTQKLWGDWRCLVCLQWARAQWEPSRFEGRCLVAGVSHLWEYKEVSLAHGLVSGHEDGVMAERGDALPTDGSAYLVELKTIGLGTARHDNKDYLSLYYKELASGKKIYDYDGLWKDLSRPFGSHVRQSNIYLWLAREMGLPVKRCRYLYEYKPNQAVKEFVIPLSERIMKPILTGVASVEYALEHGEPPACPNDDGGCKQCKAYEEMLDGKPKDQAGGVTSRRPGDAPGGTVPPRRVVRRRGGAAPARDRSGGVGEASREDAARAAGRRDRDEGPRDDAALHEPVAVDAVPECPGGGSPGRRVVRRKASSER